MRHGPTSVVMHRRALFVLLKLKVYWLQAQAPNSQGETVIRSMVRLVQVSVVAEDKKGNPVTNLRPNDFTLLDDGNPQKIAFFTPATLFVQFRSGHKSTLGR